MPIALRREGAMTIAERLRSDDFPVVRKALDELVSLSATESLPMLEELARESNPASRSYALEGMVEISVERAKALAFRSFEDPNPDVRTGAIYYLWETRDPDAVPQVSRMLRSDPDEITRDWCAIFLGAVGDESVLPVLREARQHDTGTDHEGHPIRQTAHDAIENIKARLSRTGSEEGSRQ
jgi:HEAT repeat protein